MGKDIVCGKEIVEKKIDWRLSILSIPVWPYNWKYSNPSSLGWLLPTKLSSFGLSTSFRKGGKFSLSSPRCNLPSSNDTNVLVLEMVPGPCRDSPLILKRDLSPILLDGCCITGRFILGRPLDAVGRGRPTIIPLAILTMLRRYFRRKGFSLLYLFNFLETLTHVTGLYVFLRIPLSSPWIIIVRSNRSESTYKKYQWS